MLTRQPPFDGVNEIEVMAAILDREPAPLKQHLTAVPDELQRVIGKALRKNRDERYQTARGLLNDLKDLKEELAFTAKLERTSRAARDESATVPADAVPTAAAPATAL